MNWGEMATIEELETQLSALREELNALRSTPTAGSSHGRVLSRRNLLRAAPVAAVGVGIAALSSGTATAAQGDPLLLGESNDSGTTGTSLSGGSASGFTLELDGPGLQAHGLDVGGLNVTDEQTVLNGPPAGGGPGLQLNAPVQFGAEGSNGLDGLDVLGQGSGIGISVNWTDETSINGLETHSPGAAMALTTHTCDLLNLETDGGQVTLKVNGTTTAIDGVDIGYAGTKRAIYAESLASSNINGTITGVNDGTRGIGVWGEQHNNSGAGVGVVGVAGTLGRGGKFTGGQANIQLAAGAAATHHWTGTVGDLMVDASGRLWYCQKSNTASVAAVWKQLA
ncbi:hypothetical protein acdb102_45120 [Acidothermaceae bacterium B102]|nr:hypothetical protein acdb102_45120 [Acidothermaceae bacterium B102]